MAISFEAIGEAYVTFTAGDGAEAGKVCKVSANDTVAACSAGDSFCGVVRNVRGGMAGVQVGGFAELPYTGTAPTVGYCVLAADGNGGVKTASSGRSCLVLHTNTSAGTVGVML